MQLSSEHEIHHNLKNSEIDNQVGVGGGIKMKMRMIIYYKVVRALKIIYNI